MQRYWMASAIIREDGRVLLVQNRWSIGTFWSLPGGRMEPGEVAEDAVVREVAEETGLQVEVGDLAYVEDYLNQEMELHFLYLRFPARVVGGSLRRPTADPHVVDVRWVPEAEISRYIQWPAYRDSLTAYMAGSPRRYYVNRDAGLKAGGHPQGG